MILGNGVIQGHLTEGEIKAILFESLASLHLDGKRVIILIPDSTRTMPMPLLFDLLEEMLRHRVRNLDYLVGLGTHQPMDDKQFSKLLGRQVTHGKAGNSQIFNHDWYHPENLIHIGTIPANEINKLTDGYLSQDVPVKVNKLIFNYDQVIICGPVFPHEVVGFSGGNKYLFPGIAGPEIINFTHWLGALMTSYHVIGAGYTPVRAVIDRAAAMVDRPTPCPDLVVSHERLAR